MAYKNYKAIKTLRVHKYNKRKITNLEKDSIKENPNKKQNTFLSKDFLFMENKQNPAYLGIHITERVLSKVFKNVKIMPMQNPGYDFICYHGKKIDVKSVCLSEERINGEKIWPFKINKNKIADYFLCLGFDTRQKLNPLHLWFIPGNLINKYSSLRILNLPNSEWKKYELDIEKVKEKCNLLKINNKTLYYDEFLEKEKQFEKYGLPKTFITNQTNVKIT